MSDKPPRYTIVPNMGIYRGQEQISHWDLACDIANMLDRLTREQEDFGAVALRARVEELAAEMGKQEAMQVHFTPGDEHWQGYQERINSLRTQIAVLSQPAEADKPHG